MSTSFSASLSAVTQDYVEHFTGTNTYRVVSLAVPFLFGISALPNSPQVVTGVRVLSALVLLGGLLFGYWTGRPFGLSISCTPTHLVSGNREPDKLSEMRGNILIQDGSTKLHGEMELTKFNDGFDIRFDCSSEIDVELEAKPRGEHTYDPDANRLYCDESTEYQFPIKLGVYPEGNVQTAGRYHSLAIEDSETGRPLAQFEVIDVRP